MPATLGDMAARMSQRKQRLNEEQRKFDQKQIRQAQHSDAISEPSELESSRQAPKPKRRHHRASTKSPFDDDSSVQFGYSDTKSTSSNTTGSTTPRQANKFIKKPPALPVNMEKISVARSPRDALSPRTSSRPAPSNRTLIVPPASTTGLLSQSSLLARAVRRQELHAKGLELEPGAFDRASDEDESSSDVTSTSGAKILFGSGKKSFLKKSTAPVDHQIPDLQHLDSETNSSDRETKKDKQKKKNKAASVIDTEDDSSLDFIGDGSSSEGQKTPTLTPRKSILKSPKGFIPRESERSVQFSEKLYTVRTDDEGSLTPNKAARNTTPRRVQIATKPSNEYEESISSETESISTAIDVANDDDASIDERILQSPVDNMFANLVMDSESLIAPVSKKKSPRRSPRTTKPTFVSGKSRQPIRDISDEERSQADEIPEELSVGNYSEDFTSGPTDTSTPRSLTPTRARVEKPAQPTRAVTTDDRQVQVDLMSAPFQSSLNQVHSIYLINQNDQHETRPSSLIRSVVEPHVLQSLLTTNPVLLAVDDLIREQSSLLRSFIHLQRTYYESTIRSIRPEHIYTTKDNTLQFIADHKQSRMPYQSNDDSIMN